MSEEAKRGDETRNARVRDLLAQGLTHREIGERLGMSTSGVSNIVVRLGLSRPEKSAADRAALSAGIRKMRMEGRSLREIGAAFGLSEKAVSNRLMRMVEPVRRNAAVAEHAAADRLAVGDGDEMVVRASRDLLRAIARAHPERVRGCEVGVW